MTEIIEKIFDELHGAWRFRWIGLAVAGLVALIGWIAVFTLPDRYQAYARVFVDTRTALKPVLQGLAVEQDVGAQLNFVRQSLLAGEPLERIAVTSGVLPPGVTAPKEKQGVLASMVSRVSLTVTSAGEREGDNSGGSIYGITYLDGSRERALRVVETLLNTLVEETLGGKREGAENAQKFLETQIAEYERRLRDAEVRLADFKKDNIGLMPTEQGGYFEQLQMELDAARKVETDLSVATARRAELSRQLRGESVVTASAGATASQSGGGAGSDTLTRIKETQARLDDLLLRFTAKHPDVIAAQATLVELQRRRQQEVESLRRGDSNAIATSGLSSNPVFQSIQLALNEADVQIVSLRGQLAQHNRKAAQLRQLLDTAPQVEAQLAQLNRDYEVNKAQHTALLQNLEKSRLGERADNAGSVRFEIVQPPAASVGPVSPQRTLLLGGVLIAALGAGAGVAFLLHLLWPVVGSERSLQDLTGLPILGVVSTAFPTKARHSARAELFKFAAVASCLLVGLVLVLALNWAGFRVTLGPQAGGA